MAALEQIEGYYYGMKSHPQSQSRRNVFIKLYIVVVVIVVIGIQSVSFSLNIDTAATLR